MYWAIVSILVSILSFIVAAYFYYWVSKLPTGNKKLNSIGKLIRNGSFTFLKREYTILSIFALIVSLFIFLFFPTPIWKSENILLNVYLVIAYILGSALSGLAGFIGISIATIANIKTATATKQGIEKSFMAGFRGGAVMGMAVVGTSLLGAATIYLLTGNPNIVLAFSFGASSLALFAKAGGRYFHKNS